MFPSAANVRSGSQSSDSSRECDNTNWLQNSSYKTFNFFPHKDDCLPSVVSSEKSRNQSIYKHRSKRKRSRSPKYEKVEKKPTFSADPYYIDRECNRNIYKFGSVYEGEVTKYKQQQHVPIIGFPTLRLRDLSPNALKEEAKKNRRMRYYSKKNQRRRHAAGNYVCPITLTDESNIHPLFLHLESDLAAIPPTKVDLREQSSRDVKKLVELNRTVYASPKNVRAWLQLIDLHLNDTEFAGEEGRFEGKGFDTSRRYVLLEKQIATLERALAVNSGNTRLRLLLAGLREFMTELIVSGVRASLNTDLQAISQKKTSEREWADFVFTCPQIVSVWRGYIAHLRGRFSLSKQTTSVFNRIDSVYQRALTTLSGILSGRILSHKPSPQTADQTIELFAEYCCWLSHTGFTERAISKWQAAIEFACFCPLALQSDSNCSYEDKHKEFERFWNCGVPRFGHPLARGWNQWFSGGLQINEPKSNNNVPISRLSSLFDLEENWNNNSETAHSRWNDIANTWNRTAEAAEDLLLNYNPVEGKAADSISTDSVDPSLSAYARRQQEQNPLSSGLDRRHMRGLAWIGLERTRESVGWLPASATLSQPNDVEDTDRNVKFEEIRPCLLETHLQVGVHNDELDRRKQCLILLFLEFLGVWDAEISQMYNLPKDLQILHELSEISSLQRQRISPRQFGLAWLRSTECGPGSVASITSRTQLALTTSLLDQASRLFPYDKKWHLAIGCLRFDHLTDACARALATRSLTPKAILNIWRRRAKQLLSTPAAKSNLGFWTAFASGLVKAGYVCAASSSDVGEKADQAFFTEARRVFTSTIRMYPLAEPTPWFIESIDDFLARLKLAHRFLEFELFVGAGVDTSRPSADVVFARTLHFIRHVAVGGAYSPVEETAAAREIRPGPIELAEAGSLLADRLNLFRQTITARFEQTTWSSEYRQISYQCIHLAGLLAAFFFYLQLIVLDELGVEPVLPVILQNLRYLDELHMKLLGSSETETLPGKQSRWCPTTGLIISPGCYTRQFVQFVLPGITAISVFRRRNRCVMVERFLRILADFHKGQHIADNYLSPVSILLSPRDWSFILPYRVAASCLLNVAPSCSLQFQMRMQGLLPPLMLSGLNSRFSDAVASLCLTVASYLTDTIHLSSVGRKPEATNEDGDQRIQTVTVSPGALLGISDHNMELFARVLPISLDVLLIGLELERWTSLVAGSDSREKSSSDPTAHCWSQHAIRRIRAAFERILRVSPSSGHLTRFTQPLPAVSVTLTSSFWVDQLRLVLWSAYMAFEWTTAGITDPNVLSVGASESSKLSLDAHRRKRTAVQAIFYRAIEDLPWAKVLYTDFARYCPEDVEEVVALLTEAELRLRTPLDEVDLLLTARV